MAKALDYPDYCPHGHPICPVDLRPLTRLTEMEPGQRGVVAQISELQEDVLPYLNSIGIRPGAELAIKDVAPLEGPLTIETEAGPTALSRDIAHLVRTMPPPSDHEPNAGEAWPLA